PPAATRLLAGPWSAETRRNIGPLRRNPHQRPGRARHLQRGTIVLQHWSRRPARPQSPFGPVSSWQQARPPPWWRLSPNRHPPAGLPGHIGLALRFDEKLTHGLAFVPVLRQ